MLLALAVVAWGITDDRMSGMEAAPGAELGSLGFYVSVWVVMMAAMMFPSVSPTVLIYDRLRAGHLERGRGAPADATILFVAGYLLVWTAAGLVAYGGFESVRDADPGFLAWDEAGRYVTGGVIVAAAVYQVDAVQARMPRQVPQPADVSREALAPRSRGRAGAWRSARRMVPGVLLGAYGGAVRGGNDESGWIRL